VKELDQKYLNVPLSVAITGHPEQVRGVRVRPLMLGCRLVSAVLWGGSVWWFLTRS
jgi:hypothetical protein